MEGNLSLKKGDLVKLVFPQNNWETTREIWKVTAVGYRVSGTPGGRSTVPSILFNKQGKVTGKWKKDFKRLKIPKDKWYYIKPLKRKK